MPAKSKAAITPSRRERYCSRGATRPVAMRSPARPKLSSMSRVEGWKVEARDSLLSVADASNTVTGMPRRTRQAAAARPTGPAPAMKTRSSVAIDDFKPERGLLSEDCGANNGYSRTKTFGVRRGAMRAVFGGIAAIALAMSAAGAAAQTSYPEQPIRILVGFTPGVAPDITSRLLADKFSAAWGRAVVIENVLGAGGNIACDRAAKAPPDGYTLVMCGNSSLVIAPSLYDKLPYDPVKDLAPISRVFVAANILAVHPDLPAKTLLELVALARAQPGKLTYGHAGTGTSQHLAAELFKFMAQIDIQPIAYRGTTGMLPDLLAGRVSMSFANIANALPLVREGKLRGFAVSSIKRSAAAPDLPTMAESGYSGFEAVPWFGLMA